MFEKGNTFGKGQPANKPRGMVKLMINSLSTRGFNKTELMKLSTQDLFDAYNESLTSGLTMNSDTIKMVINQCHESYKDIYGSEIKKLQERIVAAEIATNNDIIDSWVNYLSETMTINEVKSLFKKAGVAQEVNAVRTATNTDENRASYIQTIKSNKLLNEIVPDEETRNYLLNHAATAILRAMSGQLGKRCAPITRPYTANKSDKDTPEDFERK